jgi:exosome complex component RRP4
MAKLLVKNKDLVVPGEVLVEGMEYLPSGNVFREDDKIIANTIGLVSIDNRVVKLIPLTGYYTPRRDDVVIGKVANITFSGWMIDIGHSSLAMLSLKEATNEFIDKKADLSKYYNFNDIVVARIVSVTKDGTSDLSMKGPGLMKLNNGRVLNVTSSKVPRIIGKQGSMISMIKEKTGCAITVGQNGKVWVFSEDPKNELKAVEAIRLIENDAARDGLTEKVEKFLK